MTKAGRLGPIFMFLIPRREQREQHHHRLLLVPGKDDGERQVVHSAVEGVGQGQGDLDRRVGVVALADVEQPRNAPDVAEVELVETELAAGQRQDDGVLRQLLGELGVVVASRSWRRRSRR